MADEVKPVQHTAFSQLTTAQLEEMLRLDCEDIEPLDIDTILEITRILADRNKEAGISISVETAYQSFLENYYPDNNDRKADTDELFSPDHHAKRQSSINKYRRAFSPYRTLINIAASLVLILTLTIFIPSALGLENMFTVIGNWSDSIFSFVRPDPVITETQQDLMDLSNTVTAICGEDNLVPSKLPEGFTLVTIESSSNSACSQVIATFSCESKTISMQFITAHDKVSTFYEKDDTNVIIYTKGGRDHYIMENDGSVFCVWASYYTECHLFGETTINELYQIIDSIYHN